MALLPRSGKRDEDALRARLGDDSFRAALARIAAPFDGGLMLDDAPGGTETHSDRPVARPADQ